MCTFLHKLPVGRGGEESHVFGDFKISIILFPLIYFNRIFVEKIVKKII
jgi:hypothetical protein